MPYPWQENNNNTMLREAAKKNKNVASSIGMGIAKVIANTSTMTAFIRI